MDLTFPALASKNVTAMEKNRTARSTNLEPGLDIVPQLVTLDRNIVLGEPVTVEDGPAQSLVLVDVGEVLQRHRIYVLIGPGTFFVFHQSANKGEREREREQSKPNETMLF